MDRPLTEDDLRKMFVNPFYAINLDPALALEHEPMTSEETWVKGNLKLMKEIGQEEWLKTLLEVLKGDYPKGVDPEDGSGDLFEEQVEDL